jgi:hypothetical protein
MKSKHTRESLIEAARQFAAGTFKPVTYQRFLRYARTSRKIFVRYFPEGMSGLIAAAHLEHRRSNCAELLTEDQLMAALYRVAGIAGRFPTGPDVDRFGSYSAHTYYHRFGTLAKRRAAYFKWCKARNLKPVPAPKAGATQRDRTAPTLGEPMGFRGLQYAPTTESGVIYVLGALGPDAGLVVEHIGAAFPDCRAVRRLKDGTWRPVAVEFELRSSNFKAHGHDPARCDLIVCWDHDWQECPLEVMDLKSLVAKAVSEGRALWGSRGWEGKEGPKRAA